MQGWTTLAVFGLGLATIGMASYAIALRSRCAHLAAQLQTQAADRLDLANFNRLLQQVTDAEWQRYPAVLAQEVVAQGYATRAAVLAVGEQGQLEVRATTSADGLVYDPRQDAVVQRVMRDRHRVYEAEAQELCLPIPEAGSPIGLFVASGFGGNAAGHDPSQFLEVCATLAHLSLVHQRTLNRQFSLSTTDGLTGLFNHRHFQQMLGVLLAQSYLEHATLVLVMLDIDHFKRLNDTHGHLFGDLVLREMASVVRRTVPPEAFAARYGGEEFAVVLPGYSLERAAEEGERLRAAIEAHRIVDPSSGQAVGVTVSAGIASYSLGMGKSRLIGRADEALYMAKQNGRNRVTVLPPEPSDAPVFTRT